MLGRLLWLNHAKCTAFYDVIFRGYSSVILLGLLGTVLASRC